MSDRPRLRKGKQRRSLYGLEQDLTQLSKNREKEERSLSRLIGQRSASY
ncbi:MAG: hypothetical protein F6K16_38015 [Symploca sp. SIO2B6]|nr:hypothetical protein [Symploca sp. SIO2B6]